MQRPPFYPKAEAPSMLEPSQGRQKTATGPCLCALNHCRERCFEQ